MKSIVTWMMALTLMGIALPGFAQEDPQKPVAGEVSEAVELANGEKAEKPKPTMEPAIEWIMAFMTKNAPPGRKMYYPEAEETKKESLKRYRSIAEDIIEVVYHPKTKPLFKGKVGRQRTVSIILGIMLHESSFAKNVDYGLGKYGRGDAGASWCLMQMNVGKSGNSRAWRHAGGWNIKHDRPWRYGDPKSEIVEGANGKEMVKDRRKCITEGLRLIRISFRSCRRRPFKEWLNVYASGRCTAGSKGSRRRMTTGIKMFKGTYNQRKKFKDSDISTLIVAKLAQRKKDEAIAAAKKAKEAEARKAEVDKPKQQKGTKAKTEKKPQAKKDANKKAAGFGPVAARDE